MNNHTRVRHNCAHLTAIRLLVLIAMIGLTAGLSAAQTADELIAELRPFHGRFITRPQVTASGQVMSGNLAGLTVLINGAAVPLAATGTFSRSVTLDENRLFNPILIDLIEAGNLILRRRPVVISGPSLPAAALASESLAVRLSDRGINQLESLVSRFVDFDLASLLPSGPVFSDEVCLEIPLLPDICTDVDVTILNDPAPRIGAIDVDLDAEPNQLNLALSLRDLFVRAEVETDAVSCTITVNADTMQVDGALRLEPSATNPTAVDVIQVGDMTISVGNFDDDTNCGGFLGDVIEGIARRLIGDIQDLLQDGLDGFLNAIDSAGNTPLAEGLESALDMLSVESLINLAIAEFGIETTLPFARITEDDGGIDFVFNTGIDVRPNPVEMSCTSPLRTVALSAFYHVPEPLPVLGTMTPSGQPFDAAGVISPTTLNQALRTITACQLLQIELTEIDIGNGDMPITAGLVSAFLPAFEKLPPTQPLQVVLRPTLAPIVSGMPGPAGELLDLQVAAYLVEFFIPGDPLPTLQLAMDLRAGLDASIDAATGGVLPRIGAVTDLVPTLLANSLGVDPARIQFLVDLILTQVDDLNNDLEPLAIPSAEGLRFEIIEVSRVMSHLGVFLDIMPQP